MLIDSAYSLMFDQESDTLPTDEHVCVLPIIEWTIYYGFKPSVNFSNMIMQQDG